MSYTALYRKWRPASFEDVKGQDPIVQTLQNQITSGRVGHAYLFCGTRGTGKTSIAKIFARAVNCEHPVNGSPCNECAACRAISSGSSMNVVEIDAASNNGVENIRDIRDQVQYPPTEGHYRVYIIDEVHMLSIGAFNALLKTLEEPPSYVIFILATTEVHKIPITILSRCQRYDFKRIALDTIAARLRELTQAEKIQVEERALLYVAKAADGSMRDALSLLDQCVAFHLGKLLTYDNVLEVLGVVDSGVFSQLFNAVIQGRTRDCIIKLEELVIQGRELTQFVTDFIWYMRNLLLLQSADDAEGLLDMSAENLKQLQEDAGRIEGETLMRYIRVFSELSNQLRYASQKRVLVEVALIKLTRPNMEASLDSVLERLSQLEAQVEDLEARPMGAAPAGSYPAGAAPFALPGSAVGQSGGEAYPAGAVQPGGEAYPAGAVQPGGEAFPAGTVQPGGAAYPAGVVQPGGAAYPAGAVQPGGAAYPAGVVQPGGTAFPAGAYPAAGGISGVPAEPARKVALPKAQMEDLQTVRNDWAKIARSLNGGGRVYMRDTVVEPSGDSCLTIVFMDPMNYDMGKRPTVIGQLEQYVQENYGRSIYFKTRLAGHGERLNTIYVTEEELGDKIHMDITYED